MHNIFKYENIFLKILQAPKKICILLYEGNKIKLRQLIKINNLPLDS